MGFVTFCFEYRYFIIIGIGILIILVFVEEYYKSKKNKKMGIESVKATEEVEDEIDSYYIDWKCDNCSDESYLEIPKGTTVEDFLKTKICDACGCNLTIKREQDKKAKEDDQR